MLNRVEDKRKMAMVWSIAAVLLLIVLAIAWNATAEESGSSVSSSSATVVAPSDSSAANADSPSPSAQSATGANSVDRALAQSAVPRGTVYHSMDSDSAGTVFTFASPIEGTAIRGDLYWAGQDLSLAKSQVGSDILAIGFDILLSETDVMNDVRVAAQQVGFEHVVVKGFVNALGYDVKIDENSAATGYYCMGGTIAYTGKSKRFIAYGQSIYFDGVVEGDVTLSAQDIVIGPHAKVTGTLDVRSGQSVEALAIPDTAQIAQIDTTLNQPNTIDQITQIRAAIAPYFQVGSLLFLVVSFIILGLALLWGFGQKLTEANRLVRRYPLAVVVLACIALMLMFVAVMLGSLLVFTIPFSAVVLLLLLTSAIVCVPFTGSSLMLMLRHRIRPALCVIIGSGVGAALVFVPFVNLAVFFGSLIYFVGYVVNIAMFGHDGRHDASFHQRTADGDQPVPRTGGILPVAATVEEAAEAAEVELATAPEEPASKRSDSAE